MYVLRFFHLWSFDIASAIFSGGTSIVICRELILMPRYIKARVGPSILSSSSGIFMSRKAWVIVLSWVCAEFNSLPNTAKKSSE